MKLLKIISLFTIISTFTLISFAMVDNEKENEKAKKNISSKASYYADKFVGRKTANGEKYSHNNLTAAHKTLPFGTRVRVINLENGKEIIVRVNDRGPFIQGRDLDLSKEAMRRLGGIREGVIKIQYEVILDLEKNINFVRENEL